MSWLFSQALVVEYSEAICSDGEQSVQSSGSSTPQAYCAPDKMTAFSKLSRFGMTYAPLTESRGEELLTLYLEAFHAPTFLQQEKEQELTENSLECGEKWRGSFTKYNPDSSSWKTAQCSLLGDLDEFSETWPRWGLMRDGECWEQQTLAQTINVIVFGLNPNEINHPPPPPHLYLDYTDSTYEQRNKRTKRTSKKYTHIDSSSQSEMADTRCKRTQISLKWEQPTKQFADGPSWWQTEPRLDRVAYGVAARMDRLKAIGNGQVPLCAATAWKILSERI
jgi:hypothetical protein